MRCGWHLDLPDEPQCPEVATSAAQLFEGGALIPSCDRHVSVAKLVSLEAKIEPLT